MNLHHGKWRWFAVAAAMLPAALELPYYLRAMHESPLDRGNWWFAVAAAAMLTAALPCAEKRRSRGDAADLIPAALFLAAYLFAGTLRGIHTAAMLAGCGFGWSVAVFALGWPSGFTVAPAFAMLALAATGVRYRLGALCGMDGLAAQMLLAAVLAGWQAMMLFFDRRPRRGDFWFALLAAAVAAGCFAVGSARTRPPLRPDFSAGRFGEFIGTATPVTDADRRFFGSAVLERYYFPGDRRLPDGRVEAIAVLAAGDFPDAHRIHPAAHCLAAGGNRIIAETIRPETIAGTEFDVDEIVASDPSGRLTLLWVWYSTPDRSGAGFELLRLSYRRADRWFEYQLAVPLSSADPSPGRAMLRKLLNAVAEANRESGLRTHAARSGF